MKSYRTFLMASFLLLLTACGGGEDPEGQQIEEEAEESAEEAAEKGFDKLNQEEEDSSESDSSSQ